MKQRENKVVILMATLNGGPYIADQLDSLIVQTHSNWKIVISDDGSRDGTVDIVNKWATKVGEEKVEFRLGRSQGYSQNFLSMACDPSIRADFYAFCDQDDIWLPSKNEGALAVLTKIESTRPALYCGRTYYGDQNGMVYGISRKFNKAPSFSNALLQNIAGGNTMVFNHAAKILLEKVGRVNAISHDWWIYQLISGAGGFVYYDCVPHIIYRQHKNSLIGARDGVFNAIIRIYELLKGRYRRYNNFQCECLSKAKHFLEPKNVSLLEWFQTMRNSNLFTRLVFFFRSGVYRQTKTGSLGFLFALILRKV